MVYQYLWCDALVWYLVYVCSYIHEMVRARGWGLEMIVWIRGGGQFFSCFLENVSTRNTYNHAGCHTTPVFHPWIPPNKKNEPNCFHDGKTKTPRYTSKRPANCVHINSPYPYICSYIRRVKSTMQSYRTFVSATKSQMKLSSQRGVMLVALLVLSGLERRKQTKMDQQINVEYPGTALGRTYNTCVRSYVRSNPALLGQVMLGLVLVRHCKEFDKHACSVALLAPKTLQHDTHCSCFVQNRSPYDPIYDTRLSKPRSSNFGRYTCAPKIVTCFFFSTWTSSQASVGTQTD